MIGHFTPHFIVPFIDWYESFTISKRKSFCEILKIIFVLDSLIFFLTITWIRYLSKNRFIFHPSKYRLKQQIYQFLFRCCLLFRALIFVGALVFTFHLFFNSNQCECFFKWRIDALENTILNCFGDQLFDKLEENLKIKIPAMLQCFVS